MAVNHCVFMGNIGNDAVVRTSASGVVVASWAIAVDEKGKDGERKAMWLDCICYGKYANAVAPFILKGEKAVLEGRLAMNEWTDKDTGKRRRSHTLVVEHVDVITRKSQAAEEESAYADQDIIF